MLASLVILKVREGAGHFRRGDLSRTPHPRACHTRSESFVRLSREAWRVLTGSTPCQGAGTAVREDHPGGGSAAAGAEEVQYFS